MTDIERIRIYEIKKLHGEIISHLTTSFDKAIRIGELLTEEKGKLKHGEFTPWVNGNLPFTDRTARNYMRLYRERDRLKTETVSDLTSAYKLLNAPKEDESGWTPPDPDEWLQLIKDLNRTFFRHGKKTLGISETFDSTYQKMRGNDDGSMTEREMRGFSLWVNYATHLCFWTNKACQSGLEKLPPRIGAYLKTVYEDKPAWRDEPPRICKEHCQLQKRLPAKP